MKLRVTLVGDSELLRTRTERSLARVGVNVDVTCGSAEIANAIEDDAPTWFVRAGSWIARAPSIEPSATKRPLVAFGAIRGDVAWNDLIVRSRGELGGAARENAFIASVVVESPRALRAALTHETFDDAVWSIASAKEARAVRVHELDGGFDTRLRVCVAVTALRRGGAERIALDVSRGLRERGVAVRFVVINGRAATTMRDHGASGYDAPDDTLFARDIAASHADLVPTLARASHEFGADVVHTHLFDADDVRALAALGPPVVVTVHNDRARWPNGFDAVTCDDAALTLGCSLRTTTALAESRPRVRFAPNCVDAARVISGDRKRARRALEIPNDAIAVLCLANPRPQKRLELAVDTLAELRKTHDAYLVVAGDALPSPEGAAAARALHDAIAARSLERFVRVIESQRDVRDLYAASDVLLTTSAYEGMSVAQLEALAASVPVVSTDVGGARELARTHDGYAIAEATPAALACAIGDVIANERKPMLDPSFTLRAAAARHERAFRGAALGDRAHDDDSLVLVINNFSSGGAQASARRLLVALHERGHRVAAAVLQEQARFPTPWREELAKTIPISVAPRLCDPASSAAAVCDFVRARRARTVVFWNAMTSHKLRIADELVGARLFDVSPGEMYFSALERFFEKREEDLPFFEPRDYGALLDGMVVKFAAEEARAREVLGAPVHVIPNGVARPRCGHDESARSHDGPFVIGTLARISPDKKLEELLDAARELAHSNATTRFELRIAGRIERGANAYADVLRESARDLPVAWCGEVEPEHFLSELDAFAMVSEPEGCPNALLEAMSASLPIAATSVGGASDAIVDGVSGLLAPRGDGRSLGRALARIATDSSLAARLGESAGARAREHYDVTHMTNAYEALFFDRA